jgi:hypothetical protein
MSIPSTGLGKEEAASARRSIPFADRLTCTVADAKIVTGLGITNLYKLMNDGTLKSVKVGDRRLISVRSLLDLVEPCSAENKSV